MPNVLVSVVARRDVSRVARGLQILAALLTLGPAIVGPAAAATEGRSHSGKASASAEKIEVRLPPDLIFDRRIGESGTVIFRHTTHTASGSKPAAAAVRAEPRNVKLAKSPGSPGSVTFGHATHGKEKAFGVDDPAQCKRCHAAERAGR